MAPEVYQGSYTSKADIFSLGCMLLAICLDLTFFEGDKELYGIYVEESSVDMSKKFHHKQKLGPRIQTAQSSPTRIRERSFRKKSQKSLEAVEMNGKYMPIGEAQLIEPDFDLSLITGNDKNGCVKNWTKVKQFILQMLQRNPSLRPSAKECSETIFNLLEVRMTR